MHPKSWRKLKLIWIDYEQLIMDCFDCMFYGIIYCEFKGQFSLYGTNVLNSFMIFLFLAARPPRVRGAWNLLGTSVRNGLRFFLFLERKYYFIQKLSFLINHRFGNVFQFSWVICSKNTTVWETPRLKKYFSSWKKYFIVWHFMGN